MWIPLGLTEASRTPRGRSLSVIGRLKPGVSIAEAQQDLAAVHAELTRRFPGLQHRLDDQRRPAERAADRRRAAGAARPARRRRARPADRVRQRREPAARASDRTSARAGRPRSARRRARAGSPVSCSPRARSSALLGGAAGLLLAWWALHVLRTVVAAAAADPASRHGRASTAACSRSRSACRSSAGSCSVRCRHWAAPATSRRRSRKADAPDRGARRARTSSAGRRRGRAGARPARRRRPSAAQLRSSARRRSRVRPGAHADDAGLAAGRALRRRAPRPVLPALFERLDATPGVTSAGAVSFLPLTGLGSATSLQMLDRPKPPVGQEPVADVRVITHDFLRAMGVPLIEGRLFRDDDPADARGRVVVNRALARQHWPEGSAIGKRIRVSWNDRRRTTRSSASSATCGMPASTRSHAPTVYWPYPRTAYSAMTIAVRTTGDSAAMARTIVGLIRRDDAAARGHGRPDDGRGDRGVGGAAAPADAAGGALRRRGAAAGRRWDLRRDCVQRHANARRRSASAWRSERSAAACCAWSSARRLALAAVGVLVGAAGAAGLTRLIERIPVRGEPGRSADVRRRVGHGADRGAPRELVPGLRATRVDPVVALRGE